ncbi:MAG: prepilin-type N-terminal cleavage/methylation domain-containing protein [Rubrivivax sp.]|jgi:general secretion pathway protein J|nr:prepilin-type N-terminal cleavage/methylation domain-containing protein [Rubrivivax sp.]
MARARSCRRRGFTLVEVLVALFVLALMAALAWRGIDAVLSSRDAGRASIDRSMRLATILAQWETDLQALHGDAGVPALTFDGRSLRLVRRTDEGLQVVAWTVDGGRWLRWTARAATQAGELQQAWLRSQQLQAEEAGQLPLLEGVSGWQLYFFRGNAWSNAQSSGDLAGSAGDATGTPGSRGAPTRELLPSGVRLVLQLDGTSLTRDVLVAPDL